MTRGGWYINSKVKVFILSKGYISLKVDIKTWYYVVRNVVGPVLDFPYEVTYSSYVPEVGLNDRNVI